MNHPLAGRLFSLVALTTASASLNSSPLIAQEARNDAWHPPVATLHYARTREYHDANLKLVMSVDYKQHSAEGDVTHTIIPFHDNLKAIVMDAGSNLKISSCTIDGTAARFTHDGNVLSITPPRTLSKARAVSVEVKYAMPNPTSHGGANGQGGFKFIDPSASDPQRKPGFWTQGETETNRFWVPCFDFPNDKCTSEEIITVPDNWEVIGNGAQGPTTLNKQAHTATFRWKMTQPHSTYLLSLVGGEMDLVKDSWAGVPLIYACPKGQGDLLKASFGHTPDMLQFFSDTVGVKYAWPKYAQSYVYDFPGGMENVSATTLGSFGGLIDSRTNLSRLASLTSHELGHQWFGDLVTCQDWGDTWLNESFATFMAMIYDEHRFGKGAYEDTVENTRQGYLRARTLHAISTQMYANPEVMFDSSHTYDKGGVVLHMLRRYLGDDDFYHSLAHYLNVNRYKPVDAHNLEQAIEETCGRNIKPFFDQWIFKPGHPVLTPTWTYDESAHTVVVHVKQVQDTADGTPIYNLPLTIALLRDTAGSTGHVERQVVTLDKADQEFRIPAETKPNAVLIDPDHDLLRELRDVNWADDQIPTILRWAPNSQDRRYALGRIQAGPGLSEDQLTQLYVDTLHDEYNNNNASQLLRRLGDVKKESLRPIFREALKSKMDDRRPAALEALSKLPPTPEDTAAIHAIGLSDTEQYTLVDAALTALAGPNLEANMDVFRHQIASHTLRDRLALRSISLLSNAKSESACAVIISATGPTFSRRIRTDAIDALENGPAASAAIHTALLNSARTADIPTVQVAAIRVLGHRKDAAAEDVLKTLASSAKDDSVKSAAKTAVEAIEAK